MSNRYRLARVDPWTEGPRGGWFLLNDELIFQCPACRQNGGLGLHEVTASGEVNASILCDCGFHEFAVLDGWPPGWTKRRGEESIRKNEVTP